MTNQKSVPISSIELKKSCLPSFINSIMSSVFVEYNCGSRPYCWAKKLVKRIIGLLHAQPPILYMLIIPNKNKSEIGYKSKFLSCSHIEVLLKEIKIWFAHFPPLPILSSYIHLFLGCSEIMRECFIGHKRIQSLAVEWRLINFNFVPYTELVEYWIVQVALFMRDGV